MSGASLAFVAGLEVKFGCCRSRIEDFPRTPSRQSTMAIIIDPSIAKGQGLGQSSSLSPQPPPPYAESATTPPLVERSGTPGVPHAHGYGPTPIGQQQQATLPYYDPRSIHSVQAAKKRAKERFVGAVLWVLLIFALASVLVWMDLRIQLGWLVSRCASLRVDPHAMASPLLTDSAYLELFWLLLYVAVSRCMYIDEKHVYM